MAQTKDVDKNQDIAQSEANGKNTNAKNKGVAVDFGVTQEEKATLNKENITNVEGKLQNLDTKSQKIGGRRVKQEKNAFDELDAKLIKESRQDFNTFVFKGFNDDDIFVRIWNNVKSPKGVVLLTHGMVEHSLRYNEFGKFLNQNGYILVVPDLRGHGKTAGAPERVGIYDGDMFKDIVRDNIKLADELIRQYNLPLIVAGHSYGSFVTQYFIQNYHNHSAVILIGSSCFKGKLDHKLGKLVADTTALFCGKDAKAKLIYKMTFGSYSKGKQDGNWLTHDKQIYDDYQADPYCGNVCSAQFYRSFFSALKGLYTTAGINMVDKDKPILITSGAQDPVGGKNHKDIDNLAPLFQKAGVKDVTYKLWQNGYHEILNETFRNDVYEYILNWINEKLAEQ